MLVMTRTMTASCGERVPVADRRAVRIVSGQAPRRASQLADNADPAVSPMQAPRRFQPRLAAGFDEAADGMAAPADRNAHGFLDEVPVWAVLAVLAVIGAAAIVIAAAG